VAKADVLVTLVVGIQPVLAAAKPRQRKKPAAKQPASDPWGNGLITVKRGAATLSRRSAKNA
jgi:hypothetical protein